MTSGAAMRPFTSAVWLALWGSLSSLASCGNGGDVYLGRAVTPASGTGGGGNGSGLCGAEPCANEHGTKVFVDPSATDTDAEGAFGKATDGSDPERDPTILYPSNETMFPVNARNVRSEWQSGYEGLPEAEDSLFELTFQGPNTTVVVYTRTKDFVPNDEQWDWIAESNRGAMMVSLSVRELNPAEPDTAFRSAPIELYFSAQAVEGAIYYWSTAGKGVMKALLADPNPVKFYPDPESAPAEAEKCVGCHSLSRDGKHLAVAVGTELRVVSVPERNVVLPVSTGVGGAGGATPMKGDKAMPIQGSWSTFSPDGSRILVATAGKMTLLDAATGATVGPPEAIAMPGQFATHPDWSALGDRVALTLAGKGSADNKEVEGGSIAIAKVNGDTFDPPEVVVPSGEGAENNFFPVWSPDSRFLAYVSTMGKSQDSAPASVKLYDFRDNKVVDVVRLNQRVMNQDGQMKVGNSMPTWAPSTGGGPFWLAFSSIRAYGTLRKQDKKSDQIWIAAIDPNLKGDPSYAAFWAPFQSIDQGNHRAFWTHTSEDRQCLCKEVCGDQLDNDCDGTADEGDCVASCEPENDPVKCSDGVDNDCDCVIDDCAIEENCTDKIDNDGDGRIDADDPSCAPAP